MSGKTLGLALGGGGLRGAAHLGVLKALSDNGIKPDFISGTSAGSVAAALYLAGMDFNIFFAEKNTDINVRKYVDWKFHALGLFGAALSFLILRHLRLPMGIIKGDSIEQAIDMATSGKGFDDVDIPLAITSVDVNSGERLIFTNKISTNHTINAEFITDAKISEACRASISIPGIFTPKQFRGRFLIDGGVVDNVPAEILKAWGADVIVAVDLKHSNQKDDEINSIFHVLLQTVDIMGQSLSDVKTGLYADIVIDPQIYSMSLFDFAKIPECIKKGEEAALKVIPEIKSLLS
jgi:NTE family protein